MDNDELDRILNAPEPNVIVNRDGSCSPVNGCKCMRIWTCKIGECEDADLLGPNGEYYGADWPMRKAIQEAYRQVTGREPHFTFSGWAGTLTESERAVVEDRPPDRAKVEQERQP